MKSEESSFSRIPNMDNEEHTTPSPRPLRPQMYMIFNFFFNTSIIGMSVAHSAVLLPQLQSDNTSFTIDEDLGSWIVSVYSIVGPIGAFLGGLACDALGRKKTHIAADTCQLMGWILITFAQNGNMILFARILEGFARSVASTATTVLADEVTDPRFRGIILCGVYASACTGIMIMSVLGTFLAWRIAAGLVAVLAFISLIMFCFVCESPTWLLRMKQNKKAEAALRRLWGPGYENQAKEEFVYLKTRLHIQENSPTLSVSKKTMNMLSLVLKPYVIKPFLIMHFFNAIQTFCGVTFFLFYAIDILSKTAERGVDVLDVYYTNIVISCLRILAIFLSCYLIFSIGRRKLALASGVFSFVPAIIVGLLLIWSKVEEDDQALTSTKIQAYITYVLILIYTTAMSLGFLILPGIMIGETQYYKIRGFACGYMYAINDLLLGAVLKLYPRLVSLFDIHGIFLMFGISCALCTVFVYLFLPETQGLTLQQIEDYFRQPNILWVTKKKALFKNTNGNKREDIEFINISSEYVEC